MIASKFAMPGHIAPAFSGNGDDHLTCRMCLIAFSYPQRIPLSLNCLHTYCEHCVAVWTQNKTKEKLTCPICKKVTKIAKGKTPKDCLPVNHAVLELAAVSGIYPGQMASGGGFGRISGPTSWPSKPTPIIVPKINGNFLPGPSGGNMMAGFSAPDQNIVGFNANSDANYIPNGYPNLGALNQGVQGISVASQHQQFGQQQQNQNQSQMNSNGSSFPNSQQSFYVEFNAQQIGQQMLQPQQPQWKQENQQAFHSESSAQRIEQPTPFGANYQPSGPAVVPGDRNGIVSNSREFVSNVSIGDPKLPDANSCACKTASPCMQRSNQTPKKPNNQWNSGDQPQKKTTKIQVESGRDSPTNWAAKQCEEPHWEEPNQVRPAGVNINGLTPAVTALAVNQSSPRDTPEPPRPSHTTAKLNVDMCDVCGVQPASVTLTSANHTTQRLCAGCNAAAKDKGKKEHELAERRGMKKREIAPQANLDAPSSQGKTVIKVEDKNMPNGVVRGSPVCDTCVQRADDDLRRESPITANVLRLGAPATRSNAPQKTIIETTFKSDVINTKSTKVIEGDPSNRSGAADAGKAVTGKPVAIMVSIGKPSSAGTQKLDVQNRPPGGAGVDRSYDNPCGAGVDTSSATPGTSATINVGDTLRTERQEVANRKSSSRTRQPEPVPMASVRVREYVVHPLSRGQQIVQNDPSAPSAPVQMNYNLGGRNRNGSIRVTGFQGPNDVPASAPPAVQSIYEMRRPEAFNPQYDDTASDTTSISDLGLPTVQPSHVPTTKLQEAMAYSRSYEPPPQVSGVEKQGGYNSSGGLYPTLSAPPRYDEIVGASAGLGLSSQSAASSGGARLIGSFGKYGEVSTQPGTFKSPTRVNIAPDGKAVVADQANNNVQVFSGAGGECLSLIRVEGVNGCCLVKDGSLVAATNHGVEVYNMNGTLMKHVAMGPVLNVVRYGSGFIAVRPRALIIFRDMAGPSRTLADISRPGQFRQPIPFQDIADVAVNSQQDLVVLDGGAVYTLTDDGFIKSAIDPSQQPCSALRRPQAVAVDRAHNVIVSDSGNDRVLLFGANGRYLRTLYDASTGGGPQGGPTGPLGAGKKQSEAGRPRGLDVNEADQLFVVTKGSRNAEVLVLGYV